MTVWAVIWFNDRATSFALYTTEEKAEQQATSLRAEGRGVLVQKVPVNQ